MPINDTQIVTRKPEVDIQLDNLDKTIDRIDSVLSEVILRLNRVSKPMPEVPVVDSIEALVPLANQVRDLNLRAAKIVTILESLLGYMEI